jgi:hypothetical protein
MTDVRGRSFAAADMTIIEKHECDDFRSITLAEGLISVVERHRHNFADPYTGRNAQNG